MHNDVRLTIVNYLLVCDRGYDTLPARITARKCGSNAVLARDEKDHRWTACLSTQGLDARRQTDPF